MVCVWRTVVVGAVGWEAMMWSGKQTAWVKQGSPMEAGFGGVVGGGECVPHSSESGALVGYRAQAMGSQGRNRAVR